MLCQVLARDYGVGMVCVHERPEWLVATKAELSTLRAWRPLLLEQRIRDHSHRLFEHTQINSGVTGSGWSSTTTRVPSRTTSIHHSADATNRDRLIGPLIQE